MPGPRLARSVISRAAHAVTESQEAQVHELPHTSRSFAREARPRRTTRSGTSTDMPNGNTQCPAHHTTDDKHTARWARPARTGRAACAACGARRSVRGVRCERRGVRCAREFSCPSPDVAGGSPARAGCGDFAAVLTWSAMRKGKSVGRPILLLFRHHSMRRSRPYKSGAGCAEADPAEFWATPPTRPPRPPDRLPLELLYGARRAVV